ncbi:MULTISPECIES: LCP family protein [Clostridium]|uniref:LCP family protein n=1 Tax=Clostridium TaxID=1485 RepID=UPI00189957AA|nr:MULTISPECIES: LCP family protein [Clostridium]MDB2110422.1 LCP family protein [Clostridium paraputrificum]MDB2124454.1 LCP family protein [Clostridium paraputrificum]MDC0800614.1 LCP family protein [Clostridium paraputrificum]MDU7213547.1 LCP family protein [Clostridium sp.]
MKPEKDKKKMSKKTKIIITISIILALLVGSVVFGYFYVRSKIYSNSDISDITTEDSFEEVPGITNILLIGTDARDLNERARSDSIIIATIDNNTKKLKLSSIMRDTFVDIPGYGEQKINAALALGGPELLIKTIKENFNFTLDKYVMVNFWGFEDIIDGIGGIEVDVKDYEIPEINKYIGEVRDVKSPPLTTPGLQHLDGQQALAYARIRKVGNGSYERTERQRRVLDIVAEKMMDVSVVKYPGLLYDLLPSVKTNIEPLTLLNYAYTVSKFGELKFEQLQIPATELSQGGLYRNKGWVLLTDKEQNGKILNDFIYNDKPYSSEDIDKDHFNSVMANYNALNNEYKQQHGEPTHIEENDDELDKIEQEKPSNNSTTPKPPVVDKVEIPNLVGLSEGDAIAKLDALGLKCSVTYIKDGATEANDGKVKSVVNAGAKVEEGTIVSIVVYKYEKPVVPPTPTPDPEPGEPDKPTGPDGKVDGPTT